MGRSELQRSKAGAGRNGQADLDPGRVPRDADCAAKLAKRTLTNRYNQRPAWLDLAHRKLDEAVLVACGWRAGLPHDDLLAWLLALNRERSRESARAI